MTDQMIKLEPHFMAAFLASEASCAVLEVMPDTDLVEELRNLVYIQHQIMVHMIEGKHYGSNNITQFVEYTQEVKDEAARLSRD